MADDAETREAALNRLPRAYSIALRLRDIGAPPELIGEILEIDPEALVPLLQVADAKLAAVLASL